MTDGLKPFLCSGLEGKGCGEEVRIDRQTLMPYCPKCSVEVKLSTSPDVVIRNLRELKGRQR